ncbi:hypothetical protein B0H16DRAFT_1342718, partial [Mycena metata]
LPTFWPILRQPTAIVVDLDGPEWDAPLAGFTIDALISDKDNDSWRGGTGNGDTLVDVCFSPGETPIECRRSRKYCNGAHACAQVAPELLNVERYELDTRSRDAVFAARRETRSNEGNTAEEMVAVCVDRPHSFATKPQVRHVAYFLRFVSHLCAQGKSHGHEYFVACNGWRPKCNETHKNYSISRNVLARALNGQSMTGDQSRDTKPCSCIVHLHTGGKLRFCPHAHIVEGKSDGRTPIKHHPCKARRTYFVPTAPKNRRIVIIHPGPTPHNHLMPPAPKVSQAAKQKYAPSVQALGVVGATVAKVDNATSTRLIFDGQTPTQYGPALQDKRSKCDVVAQQKKKAYPMGLGINGLWFFHPANDFLTPCNQRYIHRFVNTPKGGVIIFTYFTPLLALLDDPGLTSFEDDITYNRILGEMNEWEPVVFYNALQRAITIARAYINRADTNFFELLFDTLREIKVEATGKDLEFKHFTRNGHTLVMNADMEAAQALGAARSLLKTNQPQFSGITTLDPAIFATYFIKLCCGHSIRPVNDFKCLVTPEEFRRLQDFMHIDSVKALHSFTVFVEGLGVKEIRDWWAHKEMSDWILPCLVKSQSRILPEHWDSTPATTNTGEAQHHWTNTQTGIKLSLVEGIESARSVDWRVVEEVKSSMTTGILPNRNNEMSQCLHRNTTRQSTAARHARESDEQGKQEAELKSQIAALKSGRKEASAAEKLLTAELKALKGAGSARPTPGTSFTNYESVVVSSSSSGRVKTKLVPIKTAGMDSLAQIHRSLI